jgi:hypothetical protein
MTQVDSRARIIMLFMNKILKAFLLPQFLLFLAAIHKPNHLMS